MASILTGGRTQVTVQASSTTNVEREIAECKAGDIAKTRSDDSPATMQMHKADKQVFAKYGVVT